MRQRFNHAGDIDTAEPGDLTNILNPPTSTAITAAAAELCTHLTNIQFRCLGTNLILKYVIKMKA